MADREAMMAEDRITAQELRFERMLDAPVETVWRYLVEPELRGRWFMGGTTDVHVGGKMEMIFNHDRLSDDVVPTPEKYAKYIGNRWSEKITRIDPPHLLAISWDGGEAGEVTFELSEVGDRTRLVLTHSGLRGRDDACNFGAGWRSHLAALEARVAGRPFADFWAVHRESEAKIGELLEG